MTFSRFHFIFLYFWITKLRKLAHHKFRFSRKEGAVFWDTLPRGVRISMNNNTLEEQGLLFFLQIISNHYKLQILIIIQLSSINQFAPRCRFAIFVSTLTFPAKYQRFGLVRWAGSVYISRFGTGPNSIGPWSLHMSRSHFGADLGPDQIFGTERYRLHNQIWSGPWSDKDLVRTKLVL